MFKLEIANWLESRAISDPVESTEDEEQERVGDTEAALDPG